MTFAALYATLVSVLLVAEPLVLRSSFREVGTWFWFLLGLVGLVGVVTEHRRRTP